MNFESLLKPTKSDDFFPLIQVQLELNVISLHLTTSLLLSVHLTIS